MNHLVLIRGTFQWNSSAVPSTYICIQADSAGLELQTLPNPHLSASLDISKHQLLYISLTPRQLIQLTDDLIALMPIA